MIFYNIYLQGVPDGVHQQDVAPQHGNRLWTNHAPRGTGQCVCLLIGGTDPVFQGVCPLIRSRDPVLQGVCPLIGGTDTVLQGVCPLIRGTDPVLQGVCMLLRGTDQCLRVSVR